MSNAQWCAYSLKYHHLLRINYSFAFNDIKAAPFNWMQRLFNALSPSILSFFSYENFVGSHSSNHFNAFVWYFTMDLFVCFRFSSLFVESIQIDTDAIHVCSGWRWRTCRWLWPLYGCTMWQPDDDAGWPKHQSFYIRRFCTIFPAQFQWHGGTVSI